MTQHLHDALTYVPQELKFGTSGRRGLVVDLTHLEVYINALAELEYLQTLPPAEGGIVAGDEFFIASDLRPSSPVIAQAIVAAVRDAGMKPVNAGLIPTPALAYYALSRSKASIMVTGSHIPFDRNGYKLNTSRGELLKHHEGPINERVRQVRERLYGQSFDGSPFDERGQFRAAPKSLPEADDSARRAYIARYTEFFEPLAGMRLLVHQHSAVGREMLVEILEKLGATTIAAGRSDSFIPIDTENIDAEQLAAIQALADKAKGPFHAIVSTDGDSDRPLILAVEPRTGKVRFFGGDLVGMIVAQYLKADAVVVPISCNDAIDRGELAGALEPKTRIGSPYVIAGMEEARRKGKKRVCGWEANGGFLTGTDIARDGAILTALPTRDAMLPILGVLCAARAAGVSVLDLFARLPRRFSRAALLKQFPRPVSERIVARFRIREALAPFFSGDCGFGDIAALDYTDGVRILFANGDVAHLRPSGNADELRMYAVADTQERADAIAAMGVAEPSGILRRMEAAVRAE
jgi:phosphomannomutase